MASATPSYIESWDSTEFPFHRDRSGLVRYHERVRVVLGEDGEPELVIAGDLAVASAIVEAWCSENPRAVELLLEGWIDNARQEGEADSHRRRSEEKTLADHPELAAELARDPYKVFRRAGLTDREIRVLELRVDRQRSLEEIGFAFSFSKQMAGQIVDKAIDKILALELA